jgi:putative ABC transport system permease protein
MIFINAMRNLLRSRVRTVLILICVFVIVAASSIALAIGNAAKKAEEGAISGKTISAQISYDRASELEALNSTDEAVKASAAAIGSRTLSLSAIKKYADSEYVSDFYYQASVSLNGKKAGGVTLTAVSAEGTAEEEEQTAAEKEAQEKLEAAQEQMREAQDQMKENQEKQEEYNEEQEESESSEGESGQTPGVPPGGGSQGGNRPAMPNFNFDFDFNFDDSGSTSRSNFLQDGDFSLIGYSSSSAMTSFASGALKMTSGELFSFDASGVSECAISKELASYNKLTVGSIIGLTNPSNEDETYKLKVTGIFSSSDEEETGDVSNQIYTSYKTVQTLVKKSKKNKIDAKNSFGESTTSTLVPAESSALVFKTKADYDAYEKEISAKLPENFVLRSSDAESYETSLAPLKNLSKFANVLLMIILGIGIVVLVIINTFNIRERKYEIGVLTAIGIKKWKVALQFITELLAIAIIAIFLGGVTGAISSVPVSNALLKSQVESVEKENEQKQQNLGQQPSARNPGQASSTGSAPTIRGEQSVSYVSEINATVNFSVLWKLVLIGILLTIISAAFAILSILKYDPLKILSSRT